MARAARPLIVAVLLATASGCSREERSPSAGRDEHQALLGRLAAAHAPIERIRAHAAGASLEPGVCDDAKLAATVKATSQRALLADGASLGRFAAAPERAERPSPRWAFLTSRALAELPDASSADTVERATDAVFRMQQLRESFGFVAVVRTTRRDGPRLDGERFHAGEIQGALLVYDLAASELRCATAFDARSSELVGGREAKGLEDAMWRDFGGETRRALDRAIAGMTRELVLAE